MDITNYKVLSDNAIGNVLSSNISNNNVNNNVNMNMEVTINNINLINNANTGDIIEGLVLDITDSQVKIGLDMEQFLMARLDSTANINIGDEVKFVITENKNNHLKIKPASDNSTVQKDNMISGVLDKHNLSFSEKNYNIVESLMKHNMPLDKNTIQQVIKYSYNFPDASIDNMVNMLKLGLEINESTIIQYNDMIDNNHQLSNNINNFFSNVINELETSFNDYKEGKIPESQIRNIAKEIGNSILDDNNLNLLIQKIKLYNPQKAAVFEDIITRHSSEININDKINTTFSKVIDKLEKTELEFILITITDKDTKVLFKEIAKQKFIIEVNDMENPAEISEQYKSLYTISDKLINAFAKTENGLSSELNNSSKSMQERMNFISNLNELFGYSQLPVTIAGNEANPELFVYMNKNIKKNLKEEISALLHLDMDNLGSTDIHVTLNGNNVHTRFYTEDEVSGRLIDENIKELENALKLAGFNMTNEVINRDNTSKKSANMVVEEVLQTDLEKSVKRYSFDMKM